MPAAAKLMAEHDLPAGSVQGTGRDGRVTKGDVLERSALAAGGAERQGRRRRRARAPLDARAGAGGQADAACRSTASASSATGPSSACR